MPKLPPLNWRQIESEVIEIIKTMTPFEIRQNGDKFLLLDNELPMNLNLTTFAKELAERLESTNAHR